VVNNPVTAQTPRELTEFFDKNGIRATEVRRLKGGANNQSFLILTERGYRVAKVYFRHENDRRDRLASEFSFLQYVWNRGIRNVPEPLAADHKLGIGFYGFLEGSPLRVDDIDEAAIRQAGEFIRSINRDRAHLDASGLPNASEAYFSNSEHIACVQRRVDRLTLIGDGTPVENSASKFVRQAIIPLWERIRSAFPDSAPELDENERCISPSDFGFHNALLSDNGSISFLDFEYAGWDDPVKLACDFFSQPKVPVSEAFMDVFLSSLGEIVTTKVRERIGLMLPLFRLKWLCIMFNEFLPVAGTRRSFAASEDSLTQRRTEQLKMIQSFLNKWFDDKKMRKR
jgi:hypothetical protein